MIVSVESICKGSELNMTIARQLAGFIIVSFVTFLNPAIAKATCQVAKNTADCFAAHKSNLTSDINKRLLELSADLKNRLKKRPATHGLAISITGYGLKGYSSASAVTKIADERAINAQKFIRSQLQSWGYKVGPALRFEPHAIHVLEKPSKSTKHSRALMRKVTLSTKLFVLPTPSPPKPTPPKPKESRALTFSPADRWNAEVGLSLPHDMPKVRLPTVRKCDEKQTRNIYKVWALAHHNMWRAHQVMVWLRENPKYRVQAWSYGAASANDAKLRAVSSWRNTAPRTWFGPYDKARFGLVTDAIKRVFKNRFQGKTFTVVCKKGGPDSGAKHAVYGRVVVFNNFHTFNLELASLYIVHELYHGLVLRRGTWVMDTHTFCGNTTGKKCTTKKHYDENESLRLSYGSHDRHYRLAIRNNDNYSYFVSNLGLIAIGRSLEDPTYSGKRQSTFPNTGFSF